MELTNLIGKSFGNLTVIDSKKNKHKRTVWICYCNCGKKTTVRTGDLNNGSIASCGCNQGKNVDRKPVHGLWGTRVYNTYQSMLARCYNSKQKNYKYYGGRGIIVCEKWKNSIFSFIEDMGLPPEGKTLDRINVNGNYELNNCQWATPLEQIRNRRSYG